jgi:hypothetical protein
MRKRLSADALIRTVRSGFEMIDDPRPGKPQISLTDALMSAFAMFSLKDPSLLAFEKRWKEDDSNLKSIYKLSAIPSDTQMRTILDPVPPEELRAPHNAVLRDLQRGKALEQLRYLDEGYLLSIDGTGYFSSEKLYSPLCLQKTSSKTGVITYHLQALGAAIVHPDMKEVIPLIPEIISRQDGDSKNDCELNAARRFLSKFRKEHPHLEIVAIQDGISPNGPYIRFLKGLDCHFILTVKEADHAHLFGQFQAAIEAKQAPEVFLQDPKEQKKFHCFRWVNGLALNASHKDLPVNVLEYYQVTGEAAEITKRFCWVTDIDLTEDNVYRIMRAARARWKVENETFNTLKNQGYNFEHNYGLGQQYLSMVFVGTMMLAFLVDQVQQLCCGLFRSAWQKAGSKKELWERMRSLFRSFRLDSMEMLYKAIFHGIVRKEPVICFDSS